MYELLIVGSVTAGAAVFRGLTGFGYALIAALGLAADVPASSMVPFIIINDLLLTAFTIADRGRSPIDWHVTRLILVAGIIGALGGSAIAAVMDEALARVLVSVVVVLAAVAALVHKPPTWLAHRSLGFLIGCVTGFLLGAFAVGGPLIVVWLLAGGTRKQAVRGTLAVYFGVVDFFSLGGRVALGTLGEDLPRLLITYCPLTLAGFALGYFIARRLPGDSWHRISTIGLVIIALVGAGQTVYAFMTMPI
jgi:uncharacterized membrane protein YfcA